MATKTLDRSTQLNVSSDLRPINIGNITYKFRNFVFEGGGVKGIAYMGAMEVLDERNIIVVVK